jgi:predicted dehydrogenase
MKSHPESTGAPSAPLRWGIMGCAQIVHKNWKAIHLSGNSIVRAVASRDLERSRRFVEACQREIMFDPAPEPMGSYEALLRMPDVDAVYIPLPTGIRADWVVRAAEQGKHVLCEKPCARSAAELRRMVDACAANSVQFMDGVMFMHSRRLLKLRETIEDGHSIGRLKRIHTQFTFCGNEEFFRDNIRLQSELEPQGCLGDLGWYCIRFTLWAAQWKLPRHVTAKGLSWSPDRAGSASVPTEASAELQFDDGLSAGFYCSFLTENQQIAVVGGSRGYLQLSDFVLPFHGEKLAFDVVNSTFEVKGCDFVLQPGRRRVVVDEFSNSHPTSQESGLFRNFARLALSGHPDPHWPDIAMKTQRVLDACMHSAQSGKTVAIDD